MQTILNLIIDRLCEKNVIPLEVPRLIRDILNIIRADGEATLEPVNKRLADLGWSQQVLEGDVFELIMYLIETKGETRSMSYSVH